MITLAPLCDEYIDQPKLKKKQTKNLVEHTVPKVGSEQSEVLLLDFFDVLSCSHTFV